MKYLQNIFKGINKSLILVPVLLGILSVVMMVSTAGNNGMRTVYVQSAAYVMGAILIVVMGNMDYSVVADIEKKLYIGSIVFLLTVYIPGLGVELNGARSWIDLKITTFQPSELVKLTFILLFAHYLTRHKDELRSFKGVFYALLYAMPFLLIVTKEDLGSGLVFGVIWVTMVFYAGIDGALFAKCAAAVAVCIPVAYHFMADYQKQRIEAFLHPDNLAIGANYQIYQSKTAIGSGGFFGKGLFNGTQKDLNFLPVQNSDFIYAVIVEELGFIGGIFVILAFAWLLYSIGKVALQSHDTAGSLIVIGVLGMFLFQVFENIGMTMGVMPATGITLPFLSYGGSSILSNMIAMGMVINVAIRNRGVQF